MSAKHNKALDHVYFHPEPGSSFGFGVVGSKWLVLLTPELMEKEKGIEQRKGREIEQRR